MTKYNPITLPSLERVSVNGTRFYQTPDGKQYPSVTTILSSVDNPHILEWRARVGEEEANRISARAANRGTRLHKLCEEHIMGIAVKPSIIDIENWLTFKPLVDEIGEVLALEAPLYSDYLKVAGTVDCVGYWNGKLSIIDFKTSSRAKAAADISSYYMQEAAYAVCFEERTKRPITQLVTLMSVDDEKPLVFIEHRDKWIRDFMKARKEYEERFGV